MLDEDILNYVIIVNYYQIKIVILSFQLFTLKIYFKFVNYCLLVIIIIILSI